MFKKISATLVSIFLIGCSSTTPPEWYISTNGKDTDHIYAAAEGRTLDLAKKNALSHINEQLWTQVDSSFTQSETFRKLNDNALSSEDMNNTVNAKSAQLTLTGIEFINIDQNDVAYYAQARVNKNAVKEQLQREVAQIEANSQATLDKLAHQDMLVWWLENRNVANQLSDLYVRVAILKSLDTHSTATLDVTEKLAKKIAEVQSKIVFYVDHRAQDKLSSAKLVELLGLQKINSSDKGKKASTHYLIMTSEIRQNVVGDAYITTKLTQLAVKNRSGKVISNAEIISTGNSLTNFKLSKEGSERHFNKQVVEKGIWSALGMQ